MHFPKSSPQKMKQFIGDQHSEYYLKVFESFEKGLSKNSINYTALIFGSLWFFYRKIYLKGILILFLPIIIVFTFANAKEFIPSALSPEFLLILLFLIWVAGRIFFAFRGNYFYWMKYQTYLKKQHDKNLSEYGGVTLLLPILLFIFIIIFYAGGYWLLSGMMQGMKHA
ncbi:DUF2628 domain-containing protein [Acinetobacter sichuanensis]|uniref:DUF2628 domain-containing protein n=1 Tax=Acinetobacter sichuanensis TaxID=2136183 RepID=UPI00280ECF7B|nr:DUF2628 domain-containing protein [Acinetobacter sichuanensis]MDQ9020543.1 DUF2628 domain-containing protein [Acinetobacter sichuanensis]